MIIYQSINFSVIQTISKTNGQIQITDYLGNSYNMEDVTDDGEVFNIKTGWRQQFYLSEDIEIIRKYSKQTD